MVIPTLENALIQNNQYLSFNDTINDTIFIKSSLGTGKTQRISELVDA